MAFLNTFCLIFWKIKRLIILKIVQNVHINLYFYIPSKTQFRQKCHLRPSCIQLTTCVECFFFFQTNCIKRFYSIISASFAHLLMVMWGEIWGYRLSMVSSKRMVKGLGETPWLLFCQFLKYLTRYMLLWGGGGVMAPDRTWSQSKIDPCLRWRFTNTKNLRISRFDVEMASNL